MADHLKRTGFVGDKSPQGDCSVFYARLSNQRNANEPSVEYQLGLLISEARRAGEHFDERLWTVGGDLYVEGIGRHSGHSLKQRPAMQAILERIQTRVDALISNLPALLADGRQHPDLLNQALRATFARVIVQPDQSFQIEPRHWLLAYWNTNAAGESAAA